MSRPEGCVGLAQAHCSELRSSAECPVLAQVTFLCEIPTCDQNQQKHQLPSKAVFGVEVTITVYAGTVKYGTYCLTMGSSTDFSFFAQSPGSFAKVKDSANSLLKAADYSSSSDEVSSSSSSDEDDTNHTRLAWLLLLLLLIIILLFLLHTSKYLEKADMHKYSPLLWSYYHSFVSVVIKQFNCILMNSWG